MAKLLGLNKVDILENWMHALSNLRNCCAHHSRVWNRRFIVNVLLPTNADRLFLDRDTIAKTKRNKLFAYLCCIKYILDIISPNNDFHKNLKNLISEGGKLLSLKIWDSRIIGITSGCGEANAITRNLHTNCTHLKKIEENKRDYLKKKYYL